MTAISGSGFCPLGRSWRGGLTVRPAPIRRCGGASLPSYLATNDHDGACRDVILVARVGTADGGTTASANSGCRPLPRIHYPGDDGSDCCALRNEGHLHRIPSAPQSEAGGEGVVVAAPCTTANDARAQGRRWIAGHATRQRTTHPLLRRPAPTPTTTTHAGRSSGHAGASDARQRHAPPTLCCGALHLRPPRRTRAGPAPTPTHR